MFSMIGNVLQPYVCYCVACHIVVLVKCRVIRLQNSRNVRKPELDNMQCMPFANAGYLVYVSV